MALGHGAGAVPRFGGMVRHYELALLLNPEVDDDRVGSVMDRIKRVIGDFQGEVVSEDSWGRRKLAYKIGQHVEGHYHLAHLQMDGEGAKSLDNALKLTDDVLRHMLIREDG